MKQELLLAILALFLISCESTEEPETLLLPTNMSMTLVQGSNTSRIIADFHYLPEAACLDHITWSNHQTHYFEYDELMQIRVLREMKVDSRVQEEKWFVYDGALVEQVHLVRASTPLMPSNTTSQEYPETINEKLGYLYPHHQIYLQTLLGRLGPPSARSCYLFTPAHRNAYRLYGTSHGWI